MASKKNNNYGHPKGKLQHHPVLLYHRQVAKKNSKKKDSAWKLYPIVFCILLCETAALSLLKQYSITSQMIFLIGGLAAYVCVSLLLVQSFRFEGMGMVNVLWSAFSVVFVVTTGVVLFAETVSTVEILGIAMVVIGVCILRLPVTNKVRGGQCLHVLAANIATSSK